MSVPTSDSAAIRQAIRALRAKGWQLRTVFDGEEDIYTSTEKDAIDNITAVDDAFLHVGAFNETGWVRFVMGNSPDEVICDYTVNLDGALDPLMDSWAE